MINYSPDLIGIHPELDFLLDYRSVRTEISSIVYVPTYKKVGTKYEIVKFALAPIRSSRGDGFMVTSGLIVDLLKSKSFESRPDGSYVLRNGELTISPFKGGYRVDYRALSIKPTPVADYKIVNPVTNKFDSIMSTQMLSSKLTLAQYADYTKYTIYLRPKDEAANEVISVIPYMYFDGNQLINNTFINRELFTSFLTKSYAYMQLQNFNFQHEWRIVSPQVTPTEHIATGADGQKRSILGSPTSLNIQVSEGDTSAYIADAHTLIYNPNFGTPTIINYVEIPGSAYKVEGGYMEMNYNTKKLSHDGINYF